LLGIGLAWLLAVAKIDRATIGGDTCIFLGAFGLTATELAALMNAWRARTLATDP
jgi:hypothetical protein